jgi:D-beta-D-heptose 7-phosphate kinase / D-beta-D-heptose 1-phosphate adenosyltransferase
MKVTVIGDICLDCYQYCDVLRMDRTAPVPIGKHRRTEYMLGGAANAAANIASLGIPVELIGIGGKDSDSWRLQRMLDQCLLIKNSTRTVRFTQACVKTRFMDMRGQMFARFDQEPHFQPRATDVLLEMAEACDAQFIVFSDYNLGAFDNRVVELQRKLKAKGAFTIVDPFPLRDYGSPSLVSPNLDEARAYAGSRYKISKEAALECSRNMDSDVVMSAGAEGLYYSNGISCVNIPAGDVEAADTNGAGDTVVAGLVYGLYHGLPILEACHIARDAASVAVSKHGTTQVAQCELWRERSKADPGYKICSMDKVAQLARSAKRAGLRVVVANGVFDVLHRGHLQLIEGAAAAGDYLIILLNSDASVRRAKGEGRPVQREEVRAQMIAHYQEVDIVTVFDGDTAVKALDLIRPDVLAKGPDYSKEILPETEVVERHSGVIHIVPDDYDSTTALIERIRDTPNARPARAGDEKEPPSVCESTAEGAH